MDGGGDTVSNSDLCRYRCFVYTWVEEHALHVFCSCYPVGFLSSKLKLYPDTAVIENSNRGSTVGIFF